MHRRNSTKFHHLDRRKSASSAKSVHLEHIHPETAERDAQAAASQAFARARERSTTDTTLWPPPRNSDPTRAAGSSSIHDRCNSGSPIKRQQSVRFVRENTTRGTRSTRSNTVVESMTPTFTISTCQGKTDGNNMEPRPASSASAAGIVFAAKGAAGDYINALLIGEEYYTPEDDIASVPSSYRKIRKSRSMFTCSEASIASRGDDQSPSSITINHLPTISAGSLNRGIGENMPGAKLKAPKSMSFLRGRYDQSMLFSKRRGSIPMGLSSNESVKTRTNMEVPAKSQPSVFSRSRSTNADKFLRKSMRDGSNDTLPIDGKILKDGSLRNRARKVSNSFKHKLKSFFNLVKGDTDEAEFPPQQIEASKSHIMDPNSLGHTGCDEFQFEPTSDEAAISRVPSGVPSLHAVPSYQQLRSRQGSVESLRSERRASDERSRVTSWSNSDTNTLNTLSSQKNEWDRQRLSVIKENGMHVSSSSARPSASTYGISPDARVRSVQTPMAPQPVGIDSQRIYSALMKRLNDTNKHSRRSEPQRQESVDSFIDTDAIPLRGSSRDHDKRLSISQATIRHVISDEFSDLSSARETGKSLISSGLRLDAKPDESPFHSTSKLNTRKQELSSFTSITRANETNGVADEDLPPPSVAYVDKLSPQARTLSTRSSAFFASPTCHLFRTRSPYRRAIQDSMKAESQNTRTRSPEFNPWMRSLTNLPIRCPSTCESEVDKKMYYAESVYSCRTEEPSTEPLNVSHTIDNLPRHSTTHGDATIFVSPPVYRPTPPLPPKQRVTSSASSVEWKTWLSANVSKLEGTSGRANADVMEYAVPSTRPSGHIREEAQINDDDEHLPLEVYKPTRPDSTLAAIENNVKVSPQTPRHIPKGSPPVYDCGKENEVPERPAISSKSILRTTSSSASIKSGTQEANASTKKGVFDSNRRKSLKHMPSLNTLAGNSTPTSTRKLVRRQPGYKIHVTPTTSPGLGLIVDKSSGKNSGSTNSRRIFGTMALKKTENVSPKDIIDADVDPYGVQGSGILSPGVDLNPESIGSKKIVDLFLSSRRKRIVSGGDGGVFS